MTEAVDAELFDQTPVPIPIWRLACVEEDDELEAQSRDVGWTYSEEDFG